MKKKKTVNQAVLEERLVKICSSVLAILLAFLVGGIFIAMAGADPLEAYAVMIRGAFGTKRAWSETLLRATPLLLAGTGLAVSFRCNLTSIGSEGQIIIGAIAAGAAGLQLGEVPGVIGIVICLFVGFAAGALYGGIAGLLKAKHGTSEIICTIMLNYIAISLLSMLLDGGLREAGSSYPQSAELASSLWLPRILEGNRLHLGFILALAGVLLYYIFMFRLPAGFKIRMVGFNAKASEYAGINVARNIILAMLISGGMAGLAGASEVMGIHHRLYNDFASGVGFDAMAVALLAQLHPVGLVIASVFFAALQTGSSTMQRTIQVPTMIVSVIQGLLILLIYTDNLYAAKLSLLFRKTIFKNHHNKEEG